MILYMAADLIWATRIRCSAEALGITARPVRDLEALKARLHDSEPVALLVDLDNAPLAIEMIRHLRGDSNNERHLRIRLVAWGPHVAKDLLQQARHAGADEVLPRGVFEHHLDEILLRLAGRGPQSPGSEPDARRTQAGPSLL